MQDWLNRSADLDVAPEGEGSGVAFEREPSDPSAELVQEEPSARGLDESEPDEDTQRLRRPARDLLAELANRSRGEELLLDWLGHELRNPLAAIQLAVSRIQSEAGDELGPTLAVLERQTQQLSEVIVDLLETARALSEREPLRKAAVDMSRHRSAAEPVRAGRPVGAARRKLLLVEDNGDLFDLLHALFASWDLDVLGARDGRTAIELALEHQPDLALIDIGLPVVDGYDVARAMRTALGADILLIAMSGYGQPDDHARALRAGFDEFMVKPLSSARLRELIGDVAAHGGPCIPAERRRQRRSERGAAGLAGHSRRRTSTQGG